MPSLADLHTQPIVKGCVLGHSGSGKTCLLASLVRVGYKVRVIDLDGKLLPLFNLLRAMQVPEDLVRSVEYNHVPIHYTFDGTQAVPYQVDYSYTLFQSLITGAWYGPVETWDADTVLVIDSLSALGDLYMLYTQYINMRRTIDAKNTNYGSDSRQCQDGLIDLFRRLKSEAVGCNIIFNTHIQLINTSEQGIKLFPNAPGQKLAPQIGRFFDMMILVEPMINQQGQTQRYIHTQPRFNLDLKVPSPSIPPVLDANVGLAQIFEHCRGRPGPLGSVL